ncbi:MAG TPA: precorrin-4 C(11)-methyltransferase [Candidatus Anaerotruncus excrementipullorum]|uniref:Precorrin-4 C(11)-methyltransferase n=1 Tax=Candidatus Anaerotruncus excrementipullorum TaxID=2838465 RepID=A0A9D2B729_9FIRM|nr:precorrin-4 C(11)-methyltransferase [Candidatus Anaerotruncus excrementipullorum]
MVHFVGAGCGAPDLITLRGLRLLQQADVVIYAGSLVNPALLAEAKPGCQLHNSASMTLEQVMEVIQAAEAQGLVTLRLHTGDPCLYGAIREQIDQLEQLGIPYDLTPGVSSFCGAAAALGHLGGAEYTLPGVSQSVIITRMAGRTPVPERESIPALAAHRATMVIFLSAGMIPALTGQLLEGGYPPETPAAIVYKASWPEEKTLVGTLETLPALAQENGISKTALILVGEFLSGGYDRSKLYDPGFSHGFRGASQ